MKSHETEKHQKEECKHNEITKNMDDEGKVIYARCWRELTSQQTGGKYYFNYVTGETIWEKPSSWIIATDTPATDLSSETKDLLKKYGLTYALVASPKKDSVKDPVYSGVQALAPRKDNLEIYEYLLKKMLNLYPLEFIEKSGLKQIIFCEKLCYLEQPRKAVPIVTTGTLYLDVEVQPFYYLKNVFHHEFFHIFDDKVLDLTLAYFEGHQKSGGVSNALSKEFKQYYQFFSNTRNVSIIDRHKRSACAKNGEPGIQYDPMWYALNPSGFKYGKGGESCRDETVTISTWDPKDSSDENAFLNTYSKSAAEEDKAEMFAQFMQYYRAMKLCNAGGVSRKMDEMLQRLNVYFTEKVMQELIKNLEKDRPLVTSDSKHWQERINNLGQKYWSNTQTRQYSWVVPISSGDGSQTVLSSSGPSSSSMTNATNLSMGMFASSSSLGSSAAQAVQRPDGQDTDRLCCRIT